MRAGEMTLWVRSLLSKRKDLSSAVEHQHENLDVVMGTPPTPVPWESECGRDSRISGACWPVWFQVSARDT